jgi:hypothetical protein
MSDKTKQTTVNDDKDRKLVILIGVLQGKPTIHGGTAVTRNMQAESRVVQLFTLVSERYGAVLSYPTGSLVGVRGQLHGMKDQWPIVFVDDMFCPYCLCATLFEALEVIFEKQFPCRHSNLVSATLRSALPTATPKRKVVKPAEGQR